MEMAASTGNGSAISRTGKLRVWVLTYLHFLSVELDIWWGGTNSYLKYEFVLHTPAGLAWLSPTNKGDMVLTDSKWSCGPPAYRFLS